MEDYTLSHNAAYGEIRKGAGSLYDPILIDLSYIWNKKRFIECMDPTRECGADTIYRRRKSYDEF